MGMKWTGLKEWLRDLNTDTVEAINEIGDQVEADARRFTPVVTGNLRDSWSHNTITEVGQDLVVQNDAEYAEVVEFGGPKNEPRLMLTKALAKNAGRLKV